MTVRGLGEASPFAGYLSRASFVSPALGAFVSKLQAHVRTLQLSDLQAYCDHLLRLGRNSRHDRFGWAMDDVGICAHCLRIAAQSVTVIAADIDARLRAGLELWPDPRATHAEIVFSVEEGWRNRGLASRLITHAIDEAKNRNLGWLQIEADESNPIVLRLIEKFGGIRSSSEAGSSRRIMLMQTGPDRSARSVAVD